MNKFEYKNLSPFKWFVLENFPFIEADFDALTEWQLFCKLGKEMNKIINSTNILGTQVESLTDYVKNYFENLDVQDEINNKLNEMAENGTLSNLMESYFQPIINNQNERINNQNERINNQNERINNQNERINEIDKKVTNNSLYPIPVDNTDQMTDISKTYLLTTTGDWYYYNGSTWVSGGQYQSTFIGYSQIQNYMIKDKDVYAENLKFMRSIIPFANQVVNAKLAGYNTSTFKLVFDYNSSDFITFIFNLNDIQNLGEIRFSYDNNISYNSFIFYTENQKAFNKASTEINDKNNKIEYNAWNTTFDKIAICVPKNNVYIYNQADYYNNPDNLQETLSNNITIKNSNIAEQINSNNLNLKRIDLTKVNGVTIFPNKIIVGYKLDYTDIDLRY